MHLVDLHLHTTFSDGRLTPTELIKLVRTKGLRVISITDHDSTEGLNEAFTASRGSPKLDIIPGIELGTSTPGNEIHMLGYFIDYTNTDFQNTLSEFRGGRVERAKLMVEKLDKLGIHVQWDRVKQLAGGGAIGQPHIALAMVEKGYIKEPRDAFDKYLGNNGLAYVERGKLTPEKAIQLIKSVGGVAVLAHPLDLNNLPAALKPLVGAGLGGMEVFYAQYSADKIKELSFMANDFGLVPCGGSDYHALGNTVEPLPGSMGPPIDTIDKLKSLRP